MRNTIGINIGELSYVNLEAVIRTNLGPYLYYKPRRNQDQYDIDPHFRTNIRELYLKDLKGSKVFRILLSTMTPQELTKIIKNGKGYLRTKYAQVNYAMVIVVFKTNIFQEVYLM